LTFYATLTTLESQGLLVKLDADLPDDVLPKRLFYMLPRVAEWLENDLANVLRQWDEVLEPIEQVDQLFQRYAAGQALSHGKEFHALTPLDHSAWELKTADVRIAGWFVEMDVFVATGAKDAETVKKLHLYKPLAEEAARERSRLGLPFVQGDDPNVVLSIEN
jgi:hypothetical protein